MAVPPSNQRTGERPSARLVAADASPLIGLAAAGAFDVLRGLFGRVVVSRSVVDEVMAGGDRPGAGELTAAMRSGWIRVVPTPMTTWRMPEADVGEASTIAIALEHGPAALALIDDRLGRQLAAERGVRVMNVADVLLAAKRAGLVESVAPLMKTLARKGFTMAEDDGRRVLREAGEVS